MKIILEAKRRVGNFIKSKRLLAGLSQAEIANALGYSTPQFISNWERGISLPPIGSLRKIAELLKVPAEELFELVLEVEVFIATEELKRKFWRSKK